MSVRSEFDTVVIDSDGDALSGVEATVYLAGTLTPATIYSTRGGGGTLANPITTPATGLVQFWAAAGTYDVAFHDPNLPARISDRTISFESVSGADDGIPQAKIEGLEASLDALAALVVPVGTVLPYAASSSPTGFFACDGSAYSQATYADLYAVVGSTYGSSGGNFNVPDLRGRVPIKADGSAGRVSSNNALGQSAGEQTHVLSLTEAPAHTHNTSLAPYSLINSLGGGVGGGANQYGPITAFATNPTFNTDSKGGNGAHNNMQPYLVLNYIIKY